ncbi:MAG: molecular chaperone TorD family protein [Deltaproteobacteria bacterium]|nr:molecular chaperone TorD family protein [Deltaproteobacteria bacterium]
MELSGLESELDRTTASRSQLYALLALAFGFPDQELHGAIREGLIARSIAELCAALPHQLSAVVTADLAAAADAYVDFESEYIRLFDVGAAGPPCPLYGGVYIGDRMKNMEEATRFYNYFELRLSPEVRELPDHITTELEFLHYLTFREAEIGQHGGDVSSLLRAERDFLERHLCRWVPRLRERLAKQKPAVFFAALVDFAIAFFEADRAYAAALAGD